MQYAATPFPPPVTSGLAQGPAGRRFEPRLTLAVALAALGLVAGGYAVSQQTSSTGSAGSAPQAMTQRPGMIDKLLSTSALPGFSLLADPATVYGAGEWAAAERAASPPAERARLQTLGFVSGISEQLRASRPGTAAVTSSVERFRTAAGARSELVHKYAALEHQAGASVASFPVMAIPGAHGVRVIAGATTQRAVVFTSGASFYELSTAGAGLAAPGEPQLSAAAGFQYLLVNGCVSTTARHGSAGVRTSKVSRASAAPPVMRP